MFQKKLQYIGFHSQHPQPQGAPSQHTRDPKTSPCSALAFVGSFAHVDLNKQVGFSSLVGRSKLAPKKKHVSAAAAAAATTPTATATAIRIDRMRRICLLELQVASSCCLSSVFLLSACQLINRFEAGIPVSSGLKLAGPLKVEGCWNGVAKLSEISTSEVKAHPNQSSFSHRSTERLPPPAYLASLLSSMWLASQTERYFYYDACRLQGKWCMSFMLRAPNRKELHVYTLWPCQN